MKRTLYFGLLSLALSIISPPLLAEENVCLSHIQEHIHQIGLEDFELDLTNCALQDSDMQKVTEAFKQYPGIRWLDLDYNKITDQGIKLLSGIDNLAVIGVDGNNITDVGAQDLINKTKHLDQFSADKNHLTNQTISALAKTPIPMISLNDNKITDASPLADRQALALNRNPLTSNSLLNLANSHSLQILYIAGTHLNESCLQALRDNLSIWDLNISETNIGDKGIKILSDNHWLTNLTAGKNQISDAGVQEGIAKMLDLSSLYLNDNNITAKGVSSIPIWKLELLDLSNNHIGDNGVQALQGKQINYLFLDGNKIQMKESAAYLIKTFPTLITLSVNNNKLGTEGAKELAKHYFSGGVYIDNNNIGNEGSLALAESVGYTLSLANNGLDDQGITKLEPNLSPTLYLLDVRKNPNITSVGIQLLKNHKPSIRKLYVDEGLPNGNNTFQQQNHFLNAITIDRLCSQGKKYRLCSYKNIKTKIALPH